MNSDFTGPVNIGSEEMVIAISGKKITLRYIFGPLGVRGRKSDNRLIRKKLGWSPDYPLEKVLIPTYRWINNELGKTCHDRDTT